MPMNKVDTLMKAMQTSKMAFDYNFTMMMATYEQNKLLLHTFLNQSSDVPEEAKSAVETWLKAYRKGCDDFKKMADDGYELVEKSLDAHK